MICIVDYDGGNINSLSNILNRLGIAFKISKELNDLNNAKKIILPGVSNFSYCIKKIKELNLEKCLKSQIFEKKKPFLGICSGMQILSKFSEEGNTNGLSFIDATVKKFNSSPEHRVPHVGWNKVYFNENKLFKNIKNGSRFYFCHSFYVETNDSNIDTAKTNYNVDFVSALNINNIYAVQFHPEKSFESGMKLIDNFNNLD
jgi:imidazole glycerol-phosphate synthase subunit HisH|tara:strand:+ start:2746 stop:3351 length:606 start_codon:yes stop_codon:yes gene_type:complete